MNKKLRELREREKILEGIDFDVRLGIDTLKIYDKDGLKFIATMEGVTVAVDLLKALKENGLLKEGR